MVSSVIEDILLRSNTRWKALDETYHIDIFLHISKRKCHLITSQLSGERFVIRQRTKEYSLQFSSLLSSTGSRHLPLCAFSVCVSPSYAGNATFCCGARFSKANIRGHSSIGRLLGEETLASPIRKTDFVLVIDT